MQREEEELQIEEQQKGNSYIVFQDRSLQASLKTILIIEYTHLINVAPKRAESCWVLAEPRFPPGTWDRPDTCLHPSHGLGLASV